MFIPTAMQSLSPDQLMLKALEVARKSSAKTDVPVAALVYSSTGELLAAEVNRREADTDPTAHAEILALRAAAIKQGEGWRLTDCSLVVTMEPCVMCAGAIMLARIKKLIFGCYETKTGAVGSVWDFLRDKPVGYAIEILGGVQAELCAALVEDFFINLRNSK